MINLGVLRNSRLRSCFNARSTRLYLFIKKKSVTKMMSDLKISNHFNLLMKNKNESTCECHFEALIKLLSKDIQITKSKEMMI